MFSLILAARFMTCFVQLPEESQCNLVVWGYFLQRMLKLRSRAPIQYKDVILPV